MLCRTPAARAASRLQQPRQRAPQSRGAAALEPSSMREDDALGIERDESRRGSRSFGAVQLQQSADIGGRLALSRQKSQRERPDTPQWGGLLRLGGGKERFGGEGEAGAVGEKGILLNQSA